MATLGRRRGLFLAVAALVVAINAATLLVLDRIYTAEAVIQVDDRQRLIERSSLLSPLNVETGALKSEIDRLRSPATALKVIGQLGLANEPEFRELADPGVLDWIRQALSFLTASNNGEGISGEAAGSLRSWLQGPSAAEKKQKFEADVLERFLDRLTVTNEPRTHTLRIRYASEDRALSARVANAVAGLYIRSELDAKRNVGEIANTWYSKELAELRGNVQEAERRLASYRETHQLGSRDVPPPSHKQLSELNEKLILATADHAQAASRYEQARRAAEGGRLAASQDALGSPSMQYLQQRLSDANRRLAELSQHYGNRHAKIVEARAQVAEIRRKISDELSKLLVALRSEVDIALARRDALQASIDKLQAVVARNDHAQVQLRAYEREAEASRALLNTVLQRSKELQAEAGLQQPGVKLVSAALVPVEPSSPKVGLIMALGAVCAVIIGFCAALAADYFNQTVRGLSQGERLLGVPALGWLPKAKHISNGLVHQIPVDQPFAHYSESIRSLATLLKTRQEESGSILLVASAAPGEGKTTFALSYGLSLALARQSCLVIDTDLRRPAVVRRLQGQPEYGFADVLAGRISLWDAIEREEKTGLHYLGAGTCDRDPLEIFNAASLEGLLRTVAARYQHVIVDAPPLLAVSDALLLARFCDAAILVVRWGQTPARLAEKATRQLRAAGVEDISFVLSQVDVRRLSRLEDERYSAHYLSKYARPGPSVIRLQQFRGAKPDAPPATSILS